MQAENSDILSSFALRLSMAANRAGKTQADIAAALGIRDPGSGRVNNWFKARNFPRAAERPKLATFLGVRPEWLFHGHGTPQTFSESSEVNDAVADYAVPVREVPLISWTHAGEAASYEAMPRHWQGKIPSATRDSKAFALKIEGDSMEPKFLAGDIVICEPSSPPRNGKPVVAKYASDEVQLRIYTKLPNGSVSLASLRPEIYPTVVHEPHGFHWIFPVSGMYRPV